MNNPLEKSNPAQVEYFKDILATIHEPLLVLDAALHVLAANRSFYKFFKVKAAETIGQPIYALGNRQWDIPGLRLLLETILPQKALYNNYVVEQDFPVIGRCSLLLNARRIPRPPHPAQWILLAFEDVTERMEMDRNIHVIGKQNRTEAALQALEGKYRTIFENAIEGIYQSTPEGRFTTVNPALARMLGYASPEEMIASITDIGQQFFVELPRRIECMRLMEQQGSVSNFEFQIWRKDGGVIWASENARAVCDGNGKVLYYEGIIMDITERKQVEEALRASEERYHELIQNANDIIYSIDLTGKFTSVNRAVERIAGYTEEESLRMNLAQITAPESYNLAREYLQRKLAGNEPIIYPLEIIAKDGHKVFLELNARLIYQDGKVVGSHGIARDVTERKRAEEALRNSEERYRRLVENAPDIVYTFSNQHGGIYYSPRVQQVLGYSAEYLCANPFLWNESIHPDDRSRINEVISAFEVGKPFDVEYRIKDSQGNWVWLRDRSIGRSDGGGETWIEGLATDITERKRADELLRESEARFRAVIENSHDGILFGDAKAVIQYRSPSYNHINGFSDEERLGHSGFETAHPDDLQDVHRWWENLIAQPEIPLVAEYRIRHKDGTWRWIESTGQNLLGNPHIHSIVVTSRDITQRKQAEEALRLSEERYKLMFESAPLAINITRGTKIIYANPAYLNLFRFSQLEELKDIPPLELFTPEYRPQILEKIQQREQGLPVPNSYEVECFRKDGSRFPIIMNLTRTTFADGPATVGFIIDITERKQAEELLRESEKEFHSLAESMPQIVWVTRPDGMNIYFNQQWVDYTGLTLAESYGDGWNKPFHPDDQQRAWSAWQNATRNGATYSLECRLRRADGEYRWWLIRGVPFLDERGNISKWFGTCTDIHEMKQAEDQIHQMNTELEQRVQERTRQLQEAQEQLVRKEKLAVLGQLAGGVGHELRNPLGVISNSIYYLNLVQPDATEKIKKHHAMIEQEVRNAARIVGDLLDYARLISTDPKPASVHALVEQTLSRYTVPASVQVSLKIPADLPQVYADPLHAEQILGNLIANACQAMQPGGRLTISASLQNGMAAIAVNDTGTGITPENMQKLFEPLFTTKAGGIGLGLAVSRKLAEANGGRIEVQSEVGQGSTFTLFLPVGS